MRIWFPDGGEEPVRAAVLGGGRDTLWVEVEDRRRLALTVAGTDSVFVGRRGSFAIGFLVGAAPGAVASLRLFYRGPGDTETGSGGEVILPVLGALAGGLIGGFLNHSRIVEWVRWAPG